jgi:hypothetical protein
MRLIKSLDEEQPDWHDTPVGPSPAPSVPSDFELVRGGAGPATGDIQAAKSDTAKVAKMNELHGTRMEAVIEAVNQVEDLATLDEVKAFEVMNPNRPGGRKGVLAAIEAKAATLRAEEVAAS